MGRSSMILILALAFVFGLVGQSAALEFKFGKRATEALCPSQLKPNIPEFKVLERRAPPQCKSGNLFERLC
ncbi:hypothetical protein MJO28_013705 [Puccinia striiformis f. sp. tritici]|uniref:Uncharacterized protein n=1 Tax=Puccinia striiformis f. sp. tritici TaxID=168172 RepID=A0ACC0DV49_9BASI|nr:hypothetical protein Pst134EB_026368 [Puccinia striiformis f. sp. tritici]KAI7940053.1 hypothetical protein MJO28_013705 [Puccinia striiformis f. sp. tritici]KAI7941465.1 hypothetical protein MJO29_013539 [Puccinia striiformis f. sp. tritici]